MQPVFEVLSAADVWQDESVETMFTCKSQQSSAHSKTQQHKEAWEVADPHLKSLREPETFS